MFGTFCSFMGLEMWCSSAATFTAQLSQSFGGSLVGPAFCIDHGHLVAVTSSKFTYGNTRRTWMFLGFFMVLWFGPAGSISAWSSAVALFHAMRRFQVQPDDVSCLERLAADSWEFLIATHGQWGPNEDIIWSKYSHLTRPHHKR